jgi:nucleoid-associated protein YgaU
MTDEQKNDDEEYDDEEVTSESEEDYEDEDAEASDEPEEESEGEDSVAAWGYEEKKSRFSKEMIAGFAAIGVLVAVFGIVVYKKMPGVGDSTASIGTPESDLGDPSEASPEDDQNDPFRAGAGNGVVMSDLGPQSDPGQGDGTSNASLGGNEFGDPNLTNDGLTNLASNGMSSETASLFPNEGNGGPVASNDLLSNNGSLGSDDPFASNSETPDLFSGTSDPGLGSNSEPPFGNSSAGTSTATDEFGRPLASNEFGTGQPGSSPASTNGGASEFADSSRPDPFGGPDLSNGTSSAYPNTESTDLSSSQPGSIDPFTQDDQFVQNEPSIDGSVGNSFAEEATTPSQPDLLGGSTELSSPASNEPFGTSTDGSMTNEPFGSNAGNDSGPTGLLDRGPEASLSDGGLNDPSSTALSSNPGFANDTLSGSEFGTPQPSTASSEFGSLNNNGLPGSSIALDSGPSTTPPTPLGSEEPFGTPSTGAADSVFENSDTAPTSNDPFGAQTSTASNDPFPGSTSEPSTGFDSGNRLDSGSSEPANLFPDTNSGPASTASTDVFQPPVTSSPESIAPSSSPSSISSGPFGNERFSTGSPAGPSTFVSQPVNSGTYTIKDGDSYWNISKKVYGTAKYFQVLADYNRRTIADPQKMKAGVAIETPPASILLQRMKTVRRTAPTGLAGRVEPSGRAGSASLSASASSAAESVVVSRRETKPAEPSGILFTQQGYPLYRIGETDTLTSIASDHLGRASRWQQVYNMNRDQLQSPDKLQIGMLLKLPADASRVPLVDHVSSLR